MQQYNIDFFDRALTFVHNTIIDPVPIDDDYISSPINVIDIDSTLLVKVGQFIRIQNEEYSFFGNVTDVSPGEHETRVSFKSFLAIFDEEVLFDTHLQGTGNPSTRPTLEKLIFDYISDIYITNEDTLQRLPISVEIDSSITQTQDWSFGFRSEDEETHHTAINLYSELMVKSLNKYGVAIDINPVIHDKLIYLRITKRSVPFKIDADLASVTVKTLKYNDQAVGTNKLIVYNSLNFNQSVIFYVHPDQSWDLEDEDRITPVVRAIRIVNPEDGTSIAFAEAALEAAYSVLSGSEWDNLIELETYTDDANVNPLNISVGQEAVIYYKEASYKTILTGKKLEKNKITLLFGSNRIEYSKRRRLEGGK